MTQPLPLGFLALPPVGKGPGVLVLHAWWGLNDTIKAVCTRLAEAGFVAFAPDLYHGQVADTIAGAEILGAAIDANYQQASSDVAEAASFLSEKTGGQLAVVAFSLGGFFALTLAAAQPETIRSVVLFYATDGGFGGSYSTSKADYLGHFAENDQYEPLSNVDQLEETLKLAGRPVTFHRYSNTEHWFFEPDRPQAYNQAAASLAWERTLEFLKRPSSQ